MTDEELSHIDLHLSDLDTVTTPVVCAVVSTEHDFLHDELSALGFDSYAGIRDWMYRRPYERSLWARRSSDGRCVPVLFALAVRKYGLFPIGQAPFWLDGDASNSCSDNIGLVKTTSVPQIGGVRNPYGHRSTTPEYRKAYYSTPENRERNKEHQRRTQAKKRALLKAAKELLEQQPMVDVSETGDKLDALKKKLGVD